MIIYFLGNNMNKYLCLSDNRSGSTSFTNMFVDNLHDPITFYQNKNTYEEKLQKL